MHKYKIKFVNGELEIVECDKYVEKDGEYHFQRGTFVVIIIIKQNVLFIKEM